MNKDSAYVHTLEDYLQSSSEDLLDAEHVFTQLQTLPFDFLTHWKGMKSITMLDIGAGNGAKALNLAKALEREGITIRIDSIEPNADQLRTLRLQHARENGKYLGQIYETTLADANLSAQYDIVIIFHSLYQFPRNPDDTIDGLEKAHSALKEEGLGVVINEFSLKDTFQKMKHELYPQFRMRTPVSEKVIQKSFAHHQIPCQVGSACNFKYFIGHISAKPDLELGQALAFLFFDTLSSEPLSKNEYTQIGRCVRQQANYDEASQRHYLWNSDVPIWFCHRDSPFLHPQMEEKIR